MRMTPSITLGVSACLLGEAVRYDGGHKLDRYIADTLGMDFILIPVCPEVGCGLPVPREEMRLEGDPAAPRLMTCRTRIDLTGQMLAFCSAKLVELENMELCGFIFKERSPSCGLTAVPLHGSGASEPLAVGLFAHEVARRFPLMPLEEAERLNDPRIRENFIERVVHYRGSMDARNPLQAEQ
jgi:uncharacterized protein YbbK (DUF523 family)